MGDINDHYRAQVKNIIDRLIKIECEYGEILTENEDCLTAAMLDEIEECLLLTINARNNFRIYLTELEKANETINKNPA